MAEKNSTILENIWMNGTNDYQQRIPKETINDMSAAITYLFDPQNYDLYNQFVNALINRIGATYVHQQSWRNPLAIFKKADLKYGDKIEEIVVKWVKSHAYSNIPDISSLFGDYRPESAVWFHKINRKEFYPITVNEEELMAAFAGDGASEGLNNYIAQIMESPISSDEYDEYRIMLELLAYYDHNLGFYNRNLSSLPSDTVASGDSAKQLLKMIKNDAESLAFPSSRYRSTKIDAFNEYPCFVRDVNELVVLMTPSVKSAIDVDALMGAFHMEKGEIEQRIIVVDEFPVDGAGAILTTQDFFQCRDRVRKNTQQYNALTMSTNFFLHRWGSYSVSPVVPAICYTVNESSTLNTITQKVTGITMSAADATPDAGDLVPLTLALTGSISPSGSVVTLKPASATFNVSVVRSVYATAGVYTITIGGTPANGDKITTGIEGVWSAEVELDATSATSVTTAAAALKAAIEAATDIYTITQSSGVLTLTESDSIYYGLGEPDSDVDTDTADSPITATDATTTAATTATRAVNSPQTRVDRNGILHVDENLESGDVIAVVATAAYINPSGDTAVHTATVTCTVA